MSIWIMNEAAPRQLRFLLALLATLTSLGLAFALLSLPIGTSELADRVVTQMPESGVDHPVTAVLLNFRSYDTMLEIGVLFLAVVGVWSFGPVSLDPATLTPTGPVLGTASSVLQPMVFLVAGYLLWVGAAAPGGAFQAGAIIAAGGVLAILTKWQPSANLRIWVEGGLALGLLAFVGMATATLLHSGVLLTLAPEIASSTILMIEIAATVSIGLALPALYLGGSPANWTHREQK
ncbi:MAG: Na(+)/H(+) antiporter subunit B [Pseudomonadales bacterium]